MRLVRGKKLVATNPTGGKVVLMRLTEVEQYDIKSDVNRAFLGALLFNYEEEVQDSFYFSVDDDLELKMAFIQTKDNQKLLEWELMLINRKINLNQFVMSISENYFQKELGFSNFRIKPFEKFIQTDAKS